MLWATSGSLKWQLGMDNNSTDNLYLYEGLNNAFRMTWLQNGNVGIGSTSPGALLQLGTAGTSLGTMRMTGNTSGFVQIQPAAAAGSWTMTLPADDGATGQVLSTDGNGVTSWISALTASSGFSDGGNSFGANAFLGTNDNFGLNLETNGSTRMSITNSGAVGLGTTTPTYPLEVVRDAQDTIAAITSYTNTYNQAGTMILARARGTAASPSEPQSGDLLGSYIAKNAMHMTSTWPGMAVWTTEAHTASAMGDKLVFYATPTGGTGTAERMVIMGSGNVGIGSTNPSQRLEVNGNIAIANGASIRSLGTGDVMFGNSVSYFQVGGTGGTARFLAASDALNLGTTRASAGKDDIYFSSTDSGGTAELMRMKGTTGYVGIGTSAPTHMLHVNGPSVGEAIIRLTNTDAAQDNHIRYDVPNNSANYWLAGVDDDYGDDFLWYNSSLGKVALNIERGTNYVKIGDGGGAILPLHVENSLATNRIAHFYNSDTGNDSDGIQIRIGPTSNPTTTNDFIQFQDGDGTVVGQVEGNGAGSVNYSTTSDRRLKKDIRDTQYTVGDLLKIQVRDYSYKSSSKKTTGFIAQELYEVYPEAVSRPENEEKEFWAIDYGKLTPLLVKAVQDVYDAVISLKDDTSKLKNELKSLKESNAAKDQEIAELKARMDRIEAQLGSSRK